VDAEPLDPILIQVCVPLPMSMIFAAFTDPEQVKGWLADSAEIEPRRGGKYRLGFTAPVPFESQGEVLQLTPDLDIDFSWQAPPSFASLMNDPLPHTHVYVRLQQSPEGIDVTLEHVGWGSGEAWEEARSWHFHLWDDRLHRLKDFMIKAAYG
jgi:uncharacterized protein YndB with AHSA1/START domain